MAIKKPKAMNFSFEQKDIERFLDKVGPLTESQCWPWEACIDKKGYGQFHFAGQMRPAGRVSYLFFRGKIPARKEVNHIKSCLFTGCVNPWHLEIVTKSQNSADANRRNGFKGNQHVRP